MRDIDTFKIVKRADQESYTIFIPCVICGKVTEFVVSSQQLFDLRQGENHIQDILADKPKEEREILLSGICPICWKEEFENKNPIAVFHQIGEADDDGELHGYIECKDCGRTAEVSTSEEDLLDYIDNHLPEEACFCAKEGDRDAWSIFSTGLCIACRAQREDSKGSVADKD